MRVQVRDRSGKLLYFHHHRDGQHRYVVSRGRGRRCPVVAFEETPYGDGALLWEDENGATLLEAARAAE